MGLPEFILHGDNKVVLPTLGLKFASLVYIDPPFNTGRVQKMRGIDYEDNFEDYVEWLMVRVKAVLPCLTDFGSLFVHLDWREVHYVKVALDNLLGRSCFMNEIIWAYDYGGRSKSKWSTKHDSILWYALNPKDYIFNFEEMDRIPYMAPGLVTKEKVKRGKTPTDVWWHTIVPTNGKERTGYPTQKPEGVLSRIIKVHSDKGDIVLDFFAGSGTVGKVAKENGRGFVLIDENESAIQVMERRLGTPRTEWTHTAVCNGL